MSYNHTGNLIFLDLKVERSWRGVVSDEEEANVV